MPATVISDGTLLMDGGSIFGPVPRVQWETYLKPDRRNRIRLSLNCLLVRAGGLNILIDTGAGTKGMESLRENFALSGNKLMRGLRAQGLTPRNVHKVVLTNLRFDRAGGCTKLDRTGKIIPVFPRATYVVQSAALEDARNPGERSAPFYNEDDLLPLERAGMVEVIDGCAELAPGVSVRAVGGPRPGHQVVFVQFGSERVVFAGDLLPTPLHLTPRCIAALDESPNETLAAKRDLLSLAADEGWMVVFGQAPEQPAGYIEQRGDRYSFRPVAL